MYELLKTKTLVTRTNLHLLLFVKDKSSVFYTKLK